jgi:DNA/RNA-binding domain of Phe-tRNA-synthetase-like protein
VAGTVDPTLLAELGGIELWTTTVALGRGAEGAGRERLGRLSGSLRAAERIRERAGRLAHPAYPAFERQLGLDPAVPPTALEREAREVVVTGRLLPVDPYHDVRLAILAEVGVPLGALDARRTRGPWRVRPATGAERWGGHGVAVPDGEVVLADADGPVAPVVGDPPCGLRAGGRARAVVLYAIGVPGMPDWEVSEAVWRAARYLSGH